MSFLMERYLSSYGEDLVPSDKSSDKSSGETGSTSRHKLSNRKLNRSLANQENIIDIEPVIVNDIDEGASGYIPSSDITNRDSDIAKDDLSESGTYTLDKADPEVEEARRKIDEVFGVSRFNLPQSSSCDRVSIKNSSTDANHRPPISSSKTDGELSAKNSPIFPRACIAQNVKSQLLINPNFIRSRRPNTSLPGSNANSDSDSNSPVHPRPKNGIHPRMESPSRGSSSLHSPRRESYEQIRDRNLTMTRSGFNNLNHTTSDKGSRNSLNDFDDDISLKSEAASTESTGSNSGRNCSSEVNHSSLPPMRLNRTVALRRAKLGLDTLGVPLNLTPKSTSNTASNSHPSRSNSKPSSPAAAFVRNDGGRFSLRLSSGKKPPITQQQQQNNQINKQQPPHANTANKTRPRGRSVVSDNEVSNRNRSAHSSITAVQSSSRSNVGSSLQKSSSFNNSRENNSRESPNYRQMSPFKQRLLAGKTHPMLQSRDNPIKTLASHQLQYNQLNEETKRKLAAAERLHESIRSTLCDDDATSKGLSTLDKLVIAAILQLSHKLRHNLRFILEDERLKYPSDSDTRIMIEELLPQVAVQDRRAPESSDKSKDLSNILKNLKKIEQSFDLVSLLLKNHSILLSPEESSSTDNSSPNGYQDEY